MRTILRINAVFSVIFLLMTWVVVSVHESNISSTRLWATIIETTPKFSSQGHRYFDYAITLVEARTGFSRVLVHGQTSFHPSSHGYWSNDGNWFVYNIPNEEQLTNYYRVRLSGRDNKFLRTGSISSGTLGGTRSPDKQWIAWFDVVQHSLNISRDDGSDMRVLYDQMPNVAYLDPHRSNVYWSPDNQWVYVMGRMLYGNGAQERTPFEIYRIRRTGGEVEQLLSVEDVVGVRDVTADRILLFSWQEDGKYQRFYQFILATQELKTIVDIPEQHRLFSLEMLDSSRAIAFRESSDFSNHEAYHIVDLSTGTTAPLLPLIDNTEPVALGNPIFSPDRRFVSLMAFSGSFNWYILDVTNFHQMQFSTNTCRYDVFAPTSPFWSGEILYAVIWNDDGHCRLVRYRPEDDELFTVHTFPQNASAFYQIYSPYPNWLLYRLDNDVYAMKLDGSEDFPIALDDTSQDALLKVAWVEIPLPEHNTCLATLIGIACFGVTLLGGWMGRR